MEYPFKDLLPLDEVLEREGYYKDWTHLDPEVFYSLTQISEYIKTKGFGVDVRLLISQLAEHFGLRVSQITNAMAEFGDLKSKVDELIIEADEATIKANQSITKSEEALSNSKNALYVANRIDTKATNALNLSKSADTLSKSVQEQFNQVVIDGDSSVESAQARVDASGQTNPSLKARLDKEHNKVTAQLTQNEDKAFHNSLVSHKSSGKFITIIDDDADKGFYTKLAPIARSYGIPLTSAVITHHYDGTMVTPGYKMTLEQMHELNDEGFEFISHSYSHKRFTEETDESVIEQLTKSQEFLKEQGFNHRAIAYPTNREDERVHHLTSRYYDIAFTGYHAINRHPINQMAMNRVALELNLDGVLERIEEASEANTWLIMICHVDQGDWFTESKFRTIIEKALSEGFEFVTVEEGVKRKGNLAQFGNKTIDSDGTVYGGDIKVAGVAEYTGSTPPSGFPVDTVTIQKVRNKDLEGWGLGDLPRGGLVFTYKDSEDAYTFQKFIPSVKNKIRPEDIFYRTWAPDVRIWRDWTGNGGLNVASLGEYTGNTPPSKFPTGTITIQKVRNTDLDEWGLGDLPQGGLVFTYKDSDDTYTFQKFIPSVQNNIRPEDIMYRTWAPDVSIWRDWRGHEDSDNNINWLGVPDVNNKPISDYPVNKMLKENIRNSEATHYGLDGGGVLWTIRNEDDGFSYQKFVPVSSTDISKVKYRRWQVWNNSWGPFLPS